MDSFDEAGFKKIEVNFKEIMIMSSIDIAGDVRVAFKQALARLEAEGTSLTDLLTNEIKSNPKEVLRVISQFSDKSIQVNSGLVEVKNLSDEELLEIINSTKPVLHSAE